VFAVLDSLYTALLPSRRHFGYRTFDEVLNYCLKRPQSLTLANAIDSAIHAKVLPKIRGDDTETLARALEEAEKICEEHGLLRCQSRLESLRKNLSDIGLTSFWY
jgi:hypothetical protein